MVWTLYRDADAPGAADVADFGGDDVDDGDVLPLHLVAVCAIWLCDF